MLLSCLREQAMDRPNNPLTQDAVCDTDFKNRTVIWQLNGRFKKSKLHSHTQPWCVKCTPWTQRNHIKDRLKSQMKVKRRRRWFAEQKTESVCLASVAQRMQRDPSYSQVTCPLYPKRSAAGSHGLNWKGDSSCTSWTQNIQTDHSS